MGGIYAHWVFLEINASSVVDCIREKIWKIISKTEELSESFR